MAVAVADAKAMADPNEDNKPVTVVVAVAVAVAVGVLPKGATTVDLAVDDAVEKSSVDEGTVAVDVAVAVNVALAIAIAVALPINVSVDVLVSVGGIGPKIGAKLSTPVGGVSVGSINGVGDGVGSVTGGGPPPPVQISKVGDSDSNSGLPLIFNTPFNSNLNEPHPLLVHIPSP